MNIIKKIFLIIVNNTKKLIKNIVISKKLNALDVVIFLFLVFALLAFNIFYIISNTIKNGLLSTFLQYAIIILIIIFLNFVFIKFIETNYRFVPYILIVIFYIFLPHSVKFIITDRLLHILFIIHLCLPLLIAAYKKKIINNVNKNNVVSSNMCLPNFKWLIAFKTTQLILLLYFFKDIIEFFKSINTICLLGFYLLIWLLFNIIDILYIKFYYEKVNKRNILLFSFVNKLIYVIFCIIILLVNEKNNISFQPIANTIAIISLLNILEDSYYNL